jgi:hypothetical protein
VLEEAIGERGFPVIDVGDDGKVPGELDGHASGGPTEYAKSGKIEP